MKKISLILLIISVVLCAVLLFGCANESTDAGSATSGDPVEGEKAADNEAIGDDTGNEEETTGNKETQAVDSDTTATPEDTTAKPEETTEKPLETTAPVTDTPKVEKPSDALIKEIEEDYVEFMKEVNSGKQVSIEYYVHHYLGNYNGAILCEFDGTDVFYADAIFEITVDGNTDYYSTCNRLWVWKDGDFYTLEEALQNGILTKYQVDEINRININKTYYVCRG